MRAGDVSDRALSHHPAPAGGTSWHGPATTLNASTDGFTTSRPVVSYFAALDNSRSAVVVGPQAEKLLGFSPDEWYADPQLWLRQLHPEDRDRVLAAYERSCSEGQWFTEEYRVFSRSGEIVWFRNSIKILKDESGKPIGQEAVIWNITDSKRMPIHMLPGDEPYRLFFETCPEAILVLSNGRIIAINSAGLRLLGSSAAEELVGRRLMEFIHADDRASAQVWLDHVLSDAPPNVQIEKKLVGLDGSVRDVEASASLLEYGTELAIQLVLRNCTVQKRTAKALQQSGQQMRGYATRLDSSIEAERMRIARELHDELGQALTVIKFDVARVRRQIATADGNAGKYLDELGKIGVAIDAAMARTRHLVLELRPPDLEMLGLSVTIEAHLCEFVERTGLACDWDLEHGLDIDERSSLTVFRVLQEALTNIIRHAQAAAVHVSLRRRDTQLVLEIADDGRGMNALDTHKPGAHGLLGMYERVRELGGHLDIQGQLGLGTRIRLELPCHT
jgi:PAS domain S-box-containing protein